MQMDQSINLEHAHQIEVLRNFGLIPYGFKHASLLRSGQSELGTGDTRSFARNINRGAWLAQSRDLLPFEAHSLLPPWRWTCRQCQVLLLLSIIFCTAAVDWHVGCILSPFQLLLAWCLGVAAVGLQLPAL